MRIRRVLACLVLGLGLCAAARADVLIAGAPGTAGWLDDVVAKIKAVGIVPGNIDKFYINTGTPTVQQLSQYAAVMVFTDAGAQNATLLGDNVAAYNDAGGGVVQAVFSWHTSIPLGGRWQSGGYSPLNYATQSSGVRLFLGTKHLPNHPVLANVNAFDGGSASYHNNGGLAAGAVLIADWTNGQPLIAERTGKTGRIIGLNFYPPSSDARSDFWLASTDGGRMMANALVYVPEPATIGLLALGMLALRRR